MAAKEKYHQTKFIKRQPTLLLLTMLWALMLRKTKLIVAVADQGLLETIYDQFKPKIKKVYYCMKNWTKLSMLNNWTWCFHQYEALGTRGRRFLMSKTFYLLQIDRFNLLLLVYKRIIEITSSTVITKTYDQFFPAFSIFWAQLKLLRRRKCGKTFMKLMIFLLNSRSGFASV